MKNKILSALMALVFLFALAVNASAASEMPPPDEKGSLTLVMSYNGQPLKDGKVSILRVGFLEKNAQGSYDFRLLPLLGRNRLTQEELYDPDVAKELLANGKRQYPQSILCAPVVNGRAVFQDLEPGLYVVWQEEFDACEGLYAFQPFLISVPRWQYDHYDLDVIAEPKVPLRPEPSEPPGPPPTPPPSPPPNLPQTGQLNWPIPVMAVSGVMLVIIGLVLCTNRKRDGYEK